jgi:hypothetical protein
VLIQPTILSSWFQIFFKKITCHVERDGEETDKSLTYRMTHLVLFSLFFFLITLDFHSRNVRARIGVYKVLN